MSSASVRIRRFCRKLSISKKVTAAATSGSQVDIDNNLARPAGEPFAPELAPKKPILCIAGRSELDECAVLMLEQLLEKHDLNAQVKGPEILSASAIIRLEPEGIDIVFLSYFDTDSPAHMRYAIRRLRKRLPNAKILLGCWMAGGDMATLRELVKADGIATTLQDALELCRYPASSR
jgi:hypothetical protein